MAREPFVALFVTAYGSHEKCNISRLNLLIVTEFQFFFLPNFIEHLPNWQHYYKRLILFT